MDRSHASSTFWTWVITPWSAATGEHHRSYRQHRRGYRDVPFRGGQQRLLRSSGRHQPAQPGHAAPRPHSARPSVLLT